MRMAVAARGGQRALSSSARRLADEPKSVPLSSRCNDTAETYRNFVSQLDSNKSV